MNLKRLDQKPELLAASSRQSQRASTGQVKSHLFI